VFKNGEKERGYKDIFVFIVKIHSPLKKEKNLKYKRNILKANKLNNK